MLDSITLSNSNDLVRQLAPEIDNIRTQGSRNVRVGEYEYTVSIANGEARVNTVGNMNKFCEFFGLGHRERLRQCLNEVLRQERNEALRQNNKYISIQGQLLDVRSTLCRFEDRLEGIENHAAYGFVEVRSEFIRAAGENGMLTIDELNKSLGIKYNRPDEPYESYDLSFPYMLDPMVIALNQDGLRPIEADLAPGWRTHLCDQLRNNPLNFDLFGKINAMVEFASDMTSETRLTKEMQGKIKVNGLDKEIENLLLKNIIGFNLGKLENRDELEMYVEKAKKVCSLFKEIKSLVETPGNLEDGARIQSINECLMRYQSGLGKGRRIPEGKFEGYVGKLIGLQGKDSAMMAHLLNFLGDEPGYKKFTGDAFRIAAKTHYFRNTSKQGLEFFGKRIPPIQVNLFFRGPGGNKAVTMNMLMGEERQQRPADGWYEAITFSEMRHALRMRAAGRGAHIHFVMSSLSPPPPSHTPS